MYQTVVKSIGKDATAFNAEKMVILFGENAPQELVDYCYIIEVNNVDTITEEQRLYIDGESYEITKVGNSVIKNLNDLGHITLKFDGSTEAEQSGTLYLEDKALPTITVGSSIIIR
ncbi:PTS glucitol/sorbitol transporter subunit IIA [Macrococcus sp. DPC7161]|uniref:PTS glucitol/sorbitol transporter subunit IIA n=1 Tax=Macrococcus sp. DPC7161 TaxID=2507060 RepID=UPI00100BB5B4|nr:PTS glucitol/sorbitol transporter subunit IIA [Macrococcus sp. DPC7161]RXK17370.1 PTS sorbitol transporter subunit IIA [Macrococcus sp. DPC7161]